MKFKIDIWWLIIIIIVIIALLHQCSSNDEPKTVIKTEYVKVTDTITQTVIKEVPKKVYVEKIKTVKGKDTIIYKDKPSETTIKANQYQTELKSNNASANLQITTTGELLDVQGTINYQKEKKTIETTKNASGGFLYLETNINGFDNYTIGIDYQIKNKVIIGTSATYDDLHNNFTLNAKLGFKLF